MTLHAELNSANDRARVIHIGGFVGVAEISADADRRKDETLLLAKMCTRSAKRSR